MNKEIFFSVFGIEELRHKIFDYVHENCHHLVTEHIGIDYDSRSFDYNYRIGVFCKHQRCFIREYITRDGYVEHNFYAWKYYHNKQKH